MRMSDVSSVVGSSDRLVNQRLLIGLSAITQVSGVSLLAVFPLTLPIALIHVFLMAFGGGFGAQSFFQLWSSEMFPTLLRSTAQGMMLAVVRIALGIFRDRKSTRLNSSH